jgi:dCMP deaminase
VLEQKSTPPSFLERPSRDELGIRLATVYSLRGTCLRAQVGAVISRDGRAISAGYVGAPAGQPHCTDVGCELGRNGGCTRTVHAEANAIGFAARAGASTDGATIYTTHSPCYDCAKLIINAGIVRVCFDTPYRDPRGIELLEAAGVTVDQHN